MISKHRERLANWISAPHHRLLTPPRFEEYVWLKAQVAARIKFHQCRKWYFNASTRNAYAVNMHLEMWRHRRRGVH